MSKQNTVDPKTDLGPSTGRMFVIRSGVLWIQTFISLVAVDNYMKTARRMSERIEAWEEFERGALLLERS